MEAADTQFWLVVCGFIIAFVLAFGIGANDVANSFGTSVGSKVLTLKQACILATIFEILGSILIGAKVSGTIRKGILNPIVFEGAEVELMLGYVSALLGCCVWLILATILNYPVSGTHSIVGATVGMAIVSRGIGVINWSKIIEIVISWFLSPLLSGVVSLVMFLLIRKFILRAESPLNAGLNFLPLIYTVTIFINIGGVVESAPPLLGFDKIPSWGKILLVLVISGLVYLCVWLIVVPYMRKKIEKTLANTSLDDIEEQKLAMQPLDSSYPNKDSTVGSSAPMHPIEDDEKRNACTQVDYVQLIMSRNEDASRLVDKAYGELESHQLSQQKGVLTRLASHENTVNDSSRAEIVAASGKRPFVRMRTITAPTSASKDPLDYGDVNLTLCGYLHTIHTPAMRQQLSRTQLTNRSNQAKDRQSITNSMSGQNPSSGNLRSDNPLAKLFSHKSVDPSSTAAATVSLPDSSEHARQQQQQQQQSQQVNEKRGRFNLVPASVPTAETTTTTTTTNKDTIPVVVAEVATTPSSPAVVPAEESALVPNNNNLEQHALLDPKVTVINDKLERKSMMDDDEDVEHILDLPPKKEKKHVEEIDLYAHSDPPAAAKLFSFLQVLTAVFGSFAHGGNDVSNAIGPVIGLYLIYQDNSIKSSTATPEWILFYGGVGISMGLWVLGRRVIKTIGEDLTKITASSGFVIELASAMTVLGASLLNIPVSTTHCKVGSVVFTGRVRSKESVDWSLFRNIIIAWIVTVPVTGSIAAVCQFLLKLIFIK